MRTLALSTLFVLLFAGAALGHNGAVSLYTDETITVCNLNIAALQTDTISIFYVKDQGYDLGNAVEFRLISSNANALFTGVEWSSSITVTEGDITNGISVTGGQCLGGIENVVYLGSVYVFFIDFTVPAPKFTVQVGPHPAAQPPAINITRCDTGAVTPVVGGWFVFNGTCNPGVEPKSWGAIKGLYR